MVEKKDNEVEHFDFPEEIDDDMEYTRPRPRRSKASTGAGFPVKWVAVGAAAILFLIVVFTGLFRGGEDVPSEEFKALQSSIGAMELQLKEMEAIAERVAVLERREDELRDSLKNMNQTLGTLSQRVATLTEKFESSRNKAAAASTSPPPSGGGDTALHEVKSGETLYSIARKYDMTIKELARINKLDGNLTIHPGQKLVVNR